MIKIVLHYQQQDNQIEVLLNDKFPYSLLLGRDVPGFNTLVQLAIQQLSEQEKNPEEGTSQKYRSQGWEDVQTPD